MTDRIETKFIHSTGVDPQTGAVNVPIYLSSTFHQQSLDSFGPFDYSRSGNPTRLALEETIAKLEGGKRGFAFSSGMAAISSAFMLLSSGDHVLVSEDVYGGTYRFITEILDKFNIEYTFVNMTDLNEMANAIQPNTKVIYLETPSNPVMNITDIEIAAKLAKANNCLTFVDNTFMTPLYQNPLELGADIVLHSATKFLSGHSDVIAGLAVTKDEELGNRLGFIQNTFGSVLGAQDSYLLIQGIKTLGARLGQSSQSARVIAEYLQNHPLIEEVYYPGFSFHPGNPIHERQATNAGALLSFRLADKKSVRIFVEYLRIPVFAVSLGAVESILSYPATMSHGSMPPEEREKRGITDGLLRFSVGLEHCDDLVQDLNQALLQVARRKGLSIAN
ncbi:MULTISPECIES: cystathionine beta-lyase [Planococcus]|uniref:cysteine-S-conjugate beta-lyase n=1 Tax=Planococcus faecalis TaxID=1598147 RepID=A0ABN4XTN4_9BACL|nr:MULTISPECIES: cystathionine beta-lyase [Planococcus]AQU80107.1 cystathionine gamma-synthase [Planococcus faecalis]MDJ0330516.1 cystathionine beta-lyase [Planococcus sp. S3-L1]OHX52555.1 cystathionine gamma-synthase [Planococcus faecalis]